VADLPWLFWALPSLLLSIARFGKIVPLFFADRKQVAVPPGDQTDRAPFSYRDSKMAFAFEFSPRLRASVVDVSFWLRLRRAVVRYAKLSIYGMV
jgi:hypothetical protein